MEKAGVIAALGALAQETRLDIFRLLVQAGADGLPAGQIGERLGLPSATLSFHLNQLKHAGLVTFRRESRSLIYMAAYPAMNALLGYLTENCCQGDPAACEAGATLINAQEEPANETHAYPCRYEGTARRHPELRGAGMTVTIYHNPACGTSRSVLALIRGSGEEPRIVEYLKTPPSRDELASLINRMGIPVRDALRRKGTPYDELGLDNPALTDDDLLNAMMAHPILINRPIVVTPTAVKLCRPAERVLDILPDPQPAAAARDDGEAIMGAGGNQVAKPAPRARPPPSHPAKPRPWGSSSAT